MTKGQRLTFVAIAAAIAVVAAILIGTSGGDEEAEPVAGQTVPAQQTEPQEASPAETGTPEATATPEPTPEPPPLLRAGKDTRIEVEQGDRVRFRVRSATADHVHVHGYDIFKDVPAGETITMSFAATITGIFEIELEDSQQALGELRVNP